MEKVTISNIKGENGLVNVVRYFQNNGNQYLIYSLNEVDEAGYTRLYVAKVNGTDGMYNAETPNDMEWNEVKNLIKLIVKANKEGMPVPVQDLNPKKLTNIMLKDKKVFKLNTPLVNDLGNNQPNFDSDEESTGNNSGIQPTFETPVQPAFEMPSTPAFETPVQPTFEMPSTPAFETPVQPTFEMPSTPAFEIPNTQTSATQEYSSFETPVQPTFNMPNQSGFNLANNMNEEATLKQTNEELKKEIDKLNEEVEHYKSIIANLKEIIEK